MMINHTKREKVAHSQALILNIMGLIVVIDLIATNLALTCFLVPVKPFNLVSVTNYSHFHECFLCKQCLQKIKKKKFKNQNPTKKPTKK